MPSLECPDCYSDQLNYLGAFTSGAFDDGRGDAGERPTIYGWKCEECSCSFSTKDPPTDFDEGEPVPPMKKEG